MLHQHKSTEEAMQIVDKVLEKYLGHCPSGSLEV